MAVAGAEPAVGAAGYRFDWRRSLTTALRPQAPATADEASPEPCACSALKSAGRISLSAWTTSEGQLAASAEGGGARRTRMSRRKSAGAAAAARRRWRPHSPMEPQQTGRFEHHPDDVGWYIRRYRAERTNGGSTGGGADQRTAGLAVAHNATGSFSTRKPADDSAARGRYRAASRSDRQATAAELGTSAAKVAESSDKMLDLLLRRSTSVDQLVEKLMRRQFKAGQVIAEQQAPGFEHPVSRRNAKVQSAEAGGADQTAGLGKQPASHGGSSSSKTCLPTTKIDLLGRFTQDAASRANHDRASTDNQDGEKSRPAAEIRPGDTPYPGIMPGRNIKTRTIVMKKAIDHDGANASATVTGDISLPMKLDSKPFLENRSKRQICSPLTTGDQWRANGSSLVGSRADGHSSGGSKPSDQRRRKPHLLGKISQSLDTAEIACEKSILLNMLAQSTAGFFQGGNFRSTTDVEEPTCRVAQAGLVDYSGYWVVQSRDPKYCAFRTPVQEPKLR